MVRCFISDDHVIVRSGIVELLESNNIEVVGEASTVSDTLEHCVDKNPDVLILDLNMDSEDGIFVIESLIERYPDLKIVIFSMRESIHTIASAYKAGAMGYVKKSCSADALIDAVKLVAGGNRYFMPGYAERLAVYDTSDENEINPRSALTEKELIIFTHLANGKENEEIASLIGISPKSVANAAVKIRKTLGIPYSAFKWLAIKHNLLKLDL